MALTRCFSSLGCPELSLDEILALAATYGIPLVELRSVGGTVDLSAHFAVEFDSPAQLSRHVQGKPVRVVALNAGLKLVGATKVDREALEALVPWADALGVKWIRVFDGGRDASDAEIHEASDTIRWWRALRQDRGWQVDIVVETHDSLVSGEAIKRFLIALPDAAILWDSHLTWRRTGEDPVATWNAIRHRVVHVHVKDSVGIPSARHPFTYVLPGAGEFPLARLTAALRKNNFTGPVSLEWEKLWHPYLPSLDTALAAAIAGGWW